MSARTRVCVASCLWLACASICSAQQTVDYASVSGRVTDASGAVVPGADVTARQLETNIVTSSVTDGEGRYRFPYLKVGPYDVSVRLSGFREATRRVTVTVGGAFDVPVILSVESFDTAVTVTADAIPLESSRSQIASTVSQTEVSQLPLNGRNFLDVALLAPGVAPTNIASTQLFPETSAVAGVSLSVNSQRNLSNNFIVDGLSANDDAAGLSGITYSVDAIEQFQVVTSGGQAELGRALGGYVNIVTKSGTNSVRGSAYAYFRDDALNARNALIGRTLPMHQSQYGVSLGGPIAKDRTFYFANIEQRRLDQSGLTIISVPDTALVNARLTESGYRGPLVTTGVYANPVDTTNLLVKVDHQINPRDHVGVRYSLYDVASRHARGAGALNSPTASSHLDNLDHAVALSNILFLGSTVLETRAQVAHGDLSAPPSDPIGPAVSIAGVAAFGTSSGSPTQRINRLTQVVNNLSHQAGAHSIRLGLDLLHNDDRITYPRSIRGSYGFSSLANFLSGAYNNSGFTQTFGLSEVSQSNPNVGLYAQDEWKLHDRVTLNLGLRYDVQFLETIDPDTNNVSPRVGIAITPFDSRQTVVRASGGLFYDRVPLRALANALLSASNTTDPSRLQQISISLSPAQAGAPVFPAILPGPVAAVTLPNLTTMDRALQNAYSRQASAEIEQQFGERITVGAGYEYVRGVNLLMSINQNVPSCAAAGTNNGCRPNPRYANNSQYSAAGKSTYHGMHLSLVQRPVRWGHYRVSYTLSKGMNNLGEFFFSSPIDPFDLSKDWGRSDNDRRHRLVVNGAVRAPLGIDVSAMAQAYSAPPLNVTSGVTTVQATAGRPIVNGAFIARNAEQADSFFTLNLRASRTFRIGERLNLEGIVESFNVTNRVNVLMRNANFGAGAYPASPVATFRQITSVGESRSYQFGLRVRF
jgi:hypothetical protein